mmetsp:Transcript_9092/g.27252  ORF Transcript_9092/g.27252 Transcript_9092/m.27252 type:complete len:356 (+) Transcript_9092:167-1234(+)
MASLLESNGASVRAGREAAAALRPLSDGTRTPLLELQGRAERLGGGALRRLAACRQIARVQVQASFLQAVPKPRPQGWPQLAAPRMPPLAEEPHRGAGARGLLGRLLVVALALSDRAPDARRQRLASVHRAVGGLVGVDRALAVAGTRHGQRRPRRLLETRLRRLAFRDQMLVSKQRRRRAAEGGPTAERQRAHGDNQDGRQGKEEKTRRGQHLLAVPRHPPPTAAAPPRPGAKFNRAESAARHQLFVARPGIRGEEIAQVHGSWQEEQAKQQRQCETSSSMPGELREKRHPLRVGGHRQDRCGDEELRGERLGDEVRQDQQVPELAVLVGRQLGHPASELPNLGGSRASRSQVR